jgi:hypothetical protein
VTVRDVVLVPDPDDPTIKSLRRWADEAIAQRNHYRQALEDIAEAGGWQMGLDVVAKEALDSTPPGAGL